MSVSLTSQEYMVQALLELLKEKEYGAIRVSDICRQAGLSRQTFYKYFQDKDMLLSYLAEGLNLKYLSHRDYRKRDGFFAFWLENRAVAEVLIDRGLIRQVAKVHPQTMEMLRPLLQWDAVGGVPASETLIYEFISAGEIRLLECWRASGWMQSPEEIADVVELVVQGSVQMRTLVNGLR